MSVLLLEFTIYPENYYTGAYGSAYGLAENNNKGEN